MTARYSPVRPVRATRATPPAGFDSAPVRSSGGWSSGGWSSGSRIRAAGFMLLAVLTVGSAGAATWFGTRSVQLQRELAQQGVLLDKSVARLSEREGQLSTLLESDGALSIAHVQSDSVHGGITMYWNRRDGRAMISAYGLPRLPRDRVYALWATDSIRTDLLTTFTTDETGRALSRRLVDPRWRTASFDLLVTVELAHPGTVPNLPAMMIQSVGQ